MAHAQIVIEYAPHAFVKLGFDFGQAFGNVLMDGRFAEVEKFRRRANGTSVSRYVLAELDGAFCF